MAHDRVRIQVSFVIQLIDDFTNQIITSPAVRICADGNRSPIRKPDGCYVFLDCPGHMKISIFSHCYYEKVIEIDNEERKEPVIKVRLMPDRRYRLPEGTTCITGRAPVNCHMGIVFEHEKNSWKLLYDYQREKAASAIQIFNPTGQDLEGKQFLITDKQGKCRDIFAVHRYDMQEQKCYLRQELSADYKKVGTRIHDVYAVDSDETGFYYLPIREKIQETGICRFYIGDEVLEREIVAGKTNKVDL